MRELTDNQLRTWVLASLAAPVIHLAAGLPWTQVLWVSLLAWGIRGLLPGENGGFLKGWLRFGVSGAAAGCALAFMADCWPEQKDMKWVMAILLILAAAAAGKGKERAAQGGILLWWLIAFLMGSVLLSGASAVRAENLLEGSGGLLLKKDLCLLAVLLLPVMESRGGRPNGALAFLPVAASVLVQGVTSGKVAWTAEAPFYEYSRTVRLYGMLDRMEALTWISMMLGTFLLLSFLLTEGGEYMDQKRPAVILGSFLAFALFILWGRRPAMWLLLGILAGEGILGLKGKKSP